MTLHQHRGLIMLVGSAALLRLAFLGGNDLNFVCLGKIPGGDNKVTQNKRTKHHQSFFVFVCSVFVFLPVATIASLRLPCAADGMLTSKR